ncbi:uncharacterized protein LOC132555366 [Ylistrum balloti]|uniref:uncharacterized protein LOC132555366 n=1 Tax=Ylistrum balloti TaxID=509963 RepID=UPI00290583B8|nr:uncharacterized protein LOC132555366 [Ylistrum balloti]XP_060075697.1 uncharacterized protein LOC132555366 [Ylistrum balloti]XP_060075698.1 uncharacterized protein LOC132555366 [Ylistrum balloti]XP_060075699.1 uncharacterized protein LOC132555366 [Ylistrum balloti]
MAADSDLSTYRTALAFVAKNLEKGDVASAKFLLGENKKLFPASDLEIVKTGEELMLLLEKKRFVSEFNVVDLDSLLKNISCNQLRSELEPLKTKLNLQKDAKWKVGYTTVPHFLKVKHCAILEEKLKSQNIVALIGPPATGKTQLACNYAQDFFKANRQSVICKLDCEGKTELIKSMIDLLESLCMKPEGNNEGKANYLEEMGQMVVDYLGCAEQAQKFHLLIFDDIGDSCNEIVSKILKNIKENSQNVKIIATMNGDIDLECDPLKVTGLHDTEVVSFMRYNSGSDGRESAISKATDDEIKILAKLFGNSPFGLMLSKHYIEKSGMDISDYTEKLKKNDGFIDNTEEHTENIVQYYKKRLLAAHRIILERIELKLNDDGKILLSLIPFLHHEHIQVRVLSRLLKSGSTQCHDYEDSNVIGRLRKYVLCDLKGLGNDRVISIHDLTKVALLNRLSVEERHDRIRELLQFFATNMIMDCRLRESMNTNLLFIDHAMNVLRMAQGIEKPSVEIRLLQSYVSTLVGVTFRIGGVDNFLVNDYLTQAMALCLKMVGENVSSIDWFPSKTPTGSTTYCSNVDALVEKLCSLKTKIPEYFIQELITTMVRPDKDMEHLQMRAKDLSQYSFKHELGVDLHAQLVRRKLAVPLDHVRELFLVELLVVILYNNGRNHFLEKPRRGQLMELSWVLGKRLKEKYHSFLPIQFLITQRNGYLYNHLKLALPKDQEVEVINTAVDKYTAMLHDKEDYFEFGVLKLSKVSKNFHHIAMCRKFQIKCYCRLFKLHTGDEEKQKKAYVFGKECVEKLANQITEMTGFTAVPGLHVQIAKFYMLTPPEGGSNIEKAINHFQSADKLEESTGVGLSHFRLQALFGSIDCYCQKRDKDSLKRADEICRFLISNLHSSKSQGSLNEAKKQQDEISEMLREENPET